MASESDSNLLTGLSAMQAATEACTKATEDILNHNIDENAHKDIRDRLEQILDTDNVYTNDQIVEIVEETIHDHTSTGFEEAHPGWAAYSEDLESRMDELRRDIDSIQSWINGTSGEGDATDLSVIIQGIENKYATMLNGLTTAIEEAKRNGQTETLERLRVEYNNVLDQKKTEIDEAISNFYQQASTGLSQIAKD